jgi:urease accessory protein
MADGTAALLLLADSRLPSGAHVHSGGLEAAAWYEEDGYPVVRSVADLEGYLVGRLAVAGRVSAAFAGAACWAAASESGSESGSGSGSGPPQEIASLAELDVEYDVRTPSPAQRRASRAQGRSLLRAARVSWPGEGTDRVATQLPSGHHPVVLGACVGVIGGTSEQAATVAALSAVTGPAGAAVRLLGLDPLAVHRLLAELAGQVDQVAAEAASVAVAAGVEGDWSALPALSAPMLDILAEYQTTMEVRLFES